MRGCITIERLRDAPPVSSLGQASRAGFSLLYDHDGVCRAGSSCGHHIGSFHQTHSDEGAVILEIYRKPNVSSMAPLCRRRAVKQKLFKRSRRATSTAGLSLMEIAQRKISGEGGWRVTRVGKPARPSVRRGQLIRSCVATSRFY